MDATIRNAVMAIDRLGDAVTSEPRGNEMICRPPPGHKHRDEQLTGEFEHPVKVPQIVGHAQQADHNGAG